MEILVTVDNGSKGAGKDRSNMLARGAMYKAVAHLVLLYVINRWVVTGDILKVLEGFHHRAAQ